MADIRYTDEDVARFMRYVDKLPNGCWFWTGKWYGSFWVGGQVVRAHRFSCDVLGKKVCPPGWHRDHTCRFSLCVCPDHVEPVPPEVNQERRVNGRCR